MVQGTVLIKVKFTALAKRPFKYLMCVYIYIHTHTFTGMKNKRLKSLSLTP